MNPHRTNAAHARRAQTAGKGKDAKGGTKATPAALAADPVVQHAERTTGRTFAALLNTCQLEIGDCADNPRRWTLTCPLSISPEHHEAIRFALLRHWAWESAGRAVRGSGSERDAEGPVRDKIFAATASYESTLAAKMRCEADGARRRAGGKTRAANLKSQAALTSKALVDDWRAWERLGRPDRHLWAGVLASKHEVPRRTVDRWLKNAGCRK